MCTWFRVVSTLSQVVSTQRAADYVVNTVFWFSFHGSLDEHIPLLFLPNLGKLHGELFMLFISHKAGAFVTKMSISHL